MAEKHHETAAPPARKHVKHYWTLAAMAVLSFASMYVFMYSMVDRFANVYPNVNQLYMAGLMTAPMILIELLLMRAMYQSRKLNLAIGALAVAALLSFFLLIRRQAAVGDEQFLKSMIPHHAAAILMWQAAIEIPTFWTSAAGSSPDSRGRSTR